MPCVVKDLRDSVSWEGPWDSLVAPLRRRGWLGMLT